MNGDLTLLKAVGINLQTWDVVRDSNERTIGNYFGHSCHLKKEEEALGTLGSKLCDHNIFVNFVYI